ncbi:Putative zinc-finger [Actinopolymorpha cephalotaxi]|uniref:Regulator of SigK n=1 Tax=Actinopolymorpha cephalotaxi TaxID=504797 RepID=A0A1I2W5R5_9ACTN|nr:anti-sigma factor [Actinopolymorpha cephalotaxi]NYH82813.1 anti-sigma-K factor RskA [Actinopolymorpha cephalotaxi]SFG94871.1 Putative zinc-finger [Actinopolymorpha cephalotaxi]
MTTTPGLPDVPDLHSLTAPYVLDALPEPELREFEAHLSTCSSCQGEVRELAAVAAQLAAATATEPPEQLRARVLAAIRTTGQEAAPDTGNGRTTVRPTGPDGDSANGETTNGETSSAAESRHQPVTHGHRARRPRRRGLLALAAALVILAGVGVGAGVVQYQQAQQRTAQAVQERERIETVLAAPDSRTVRGDVRGGGKVTVVVSQQLDRAVVLLDGMSRPPRGRTYQLWFISGDSARSAGVVDVTGSGRVSEVLSGVGGANAFGISVEPQGGSKAPTTTPVAAVPLA